MIRKIKCQICENETEIDSSHIILNTKSPVCCDRCGTNFEVFLDSIKPHSYDKLIPILEIGELIKISNEQHAWHDEIGIIREKKHKHYRIEILGKLIWIPEHWVQKDDIDYIS